MQVVESDAGAMQVADEAEAAMQVVPRFNLYHGDALEQAKLLQDGSVGLFCFDPPSGGRPDRNSPTWDHRWSKEYWCELFEVMAQKLVPKDGRILICTCGGNGAFHRFLGEVWPSIEKTLGLYRDADFSWVHNGRRSIQQSQAATSAKEDWIVIRQKDATGFQRDQRPSNVFIAPLPPPKEVRALSHSNRAHSLSLAASRLLSLSI